MQHTFEITLPKPWMARNVWDRLHWAARTKYMDFLARQYRQQTAHLHIQWPLVDVQIDAIRVSSGTLDRDARHGSLKPYLDAMTTRHAKGVGLILDDTDEILVRLDADQVRVPQQDIPDPASVFLVMGREQ